MSLKGIRIIDLSHAMAGPMCSMFLGAMGAEIIKIEPPWGEITRFNPPLINLTSPYFAYINREKKGISINLKTDKGKIIFKELIKKGDIVLENFGPGAMKRLGLDYEVLKEINPKIIYATISGFGQTGPWSERLSFNPIAQAESGYMELSRDFMGLDSPKVAPEAIADTIPALFCMSGILSALYYREKTGYGQMIDVAQLDSMISVLPSVVYYTLCGEYFGSTTKKRTILGGTYKCKDGYIQCSIPLGRLHDRVVETLKKVIDKDEIDKKIFKDWTEKNTVDKVFEILLKAKIPVGKVHTLPEAIETPQIRARDMIVEIDHPSVGKIKSPGFPIKFSKTPGKIEKPSPLLGQHNEEVLSELLDYNREEIEKLKEEGVI
jgi:CoA:oxalate CoA-transferase